MELFIDLCGFYALKHYPGVEIEKFITRNLVNFL